MKLLADFLPVILFFVTFRVADAQRDAATAFANDHFGALVSGGQVGAAEAPVLLATVVVIVATLAQVVWLKARRRPVGLVLWTSLAIVVALGGATIWFHSETFIKWKPSVLYWTLAAAFAFSRFVLGRNLLKMLIGQQLELPAAVWLRLNTAWIAFFASMGVLNLYVAYHYPLATWVDFKLFGGIGGMFAFTIAQGLYLSRYMKDDTGVPDGPAG